MAFENTVYGCIQKVIGEGFVLKVGSTQKVLEERMNELNTQVPVEINRIGERMNYVVFRIDIERNSRAVEMYIHSLLKDKLANAAIDYNGKQKREYYFGCENKMTFKNIVEPIIRKAKKYYFAQPQINKKYKWIERYTLENFKKISEDEVPTDSESEDEVEYENPSDFDYNTNELDSEEEITSASYSDSDETIKQSQHPYSMLKRKKHLQSGTQRNKRARR